MLAVATAIVGSRPKHSRERLSLVKQLRGRKHLCPLYLIICCQGPEPSGVSSLVYVKP